MIIVKEVTSKKMMRDFCNFPLELFKNNKNYCPPFFSDEMKLYDPNKKWVYSEYCDYKIFLAYKDGKVAGRIIALINNAYIEKIGERCARFTRFDVIDDFEVTKALFDTAIAYFKQNGIVSVQGPMGFNDLDREGLLVEGFDYPQAYGGSYNYPYYQEHLEKLGFTKEADWIERRITLPREPLKKLETVSALVAKRYNLTELTDTKLSIRQIISRYADDIFDLIDLCYANLHGVVPLTERARKLIASQLTVILDKKYLSLVRSPDGKLIGFGVLYPAIWNAMNKCKGKLFPTGVFRLLHALKQHEYVEFALIAVHPDWQKHAVTALIMNKILKELIKDGVIYAETNATLEDNYMINNVWDNYEHIKHKRKRCYKMYLD